VAEHGEGLGAEFDLHAIAENRSTRRVEDERAEPQHRHCPHPSSRNLLNSYHFRLRFGKFRTGFGTPAHLSANMAAA
jgi:hypothetical protein